MCTCVYSRPQIAPAPKEALSGASTHGQRVVFCGPSALAAACGSCSSASSSVHEPSFSGGTVPLLLVLAEVSIEPFQDWTVGTPQVPSHLDKQGSLAHARPCSTFLMDRRQRNFPTLLLATRTPISFLFIARHSRYLYAALACTSYVLRFAL